MKALIVDDEKHVRDAIRLLVDWKTYGITGLLEAEDGESAVRLIVSESPDLVFTDMMMPGMGGAGLMEWIKTNAPRTKTVVISGHDDFDLVRSAVKCGGLDYILKPIDPGELQDAVQKAVQSLLLEAESLQQQHRRNMEVNQIKPVYWERMLSNLLEDPGYFEKIKDSLMQDLGYTLDCRECRVAVLSLAEIPPGIRVKFSSGMDLLYFSLANICNEYMGQRKSGYAFRHGSANGSIVLLFWRNVSHVQEEVARIQDGIARVLKGSFHFGLGRTSSFPGGIENAYREAIHALQSRNLLKNGGWIHNPYSDSHALKALPFREFEEELRLSVRSAAGERIAAAARSWRQSVSGLERITPGQLELWKQEFSLFQARWLKEVLGEELSDRADEGLQIADMPSPLHKDGALSLDLWEEQLTEKLNALASLYKRRLHEDKHVIYEIAKYVQLHYQEDITLQDIADRFFLSREYISRKFKQEFKENLSDYVGRIRIEKAKLLLMNPGCRIAQIAQLVGYQDEKYFSKVFKRMTGFTPGEYRKNPTAADRG
jgi:two-component system, response regulator YesN